jgi:Cornifin (SPRR) family
MVLAILLGGIFGLLVAGGVLVVGMVRQARLDQHDMNAAFADARGEAHDPVVGPAPWSSFDMEALGEDEDGVIVDRSDPYATLTGVTAVSWSHSKEAIPEDDIPALDDLPITHRTAEPDETFVAEPHETFVSEPDDIFVAEPHETFVSEPEDIFVAEPRETFVSEPEDIFVAEPRETFVSEPDETFVAKPAAMLPEPVDIGATPASIDEERPVVWRAPAQSQVVILVVALRALADAVAATITPEGATQLDELEDALASARSAYQRGKGNGNAQRSSIDVDGHDRPASDVAASPVSRDDSPKHTSSPRRSTPSTPRRHSGPKPISWRPGVR